jgi:hypothetical protein
MATVAQRFWILKMSPKIPIHIAVSLFGFCAIATIATPLLAGANIISCEIDLSAIFFAEYLAYAAAIVGISATLISRKLHWRSLMICVVCSGLQVTAFFRHEKLFFWAYIYNIDPALKLLTPQFSARSAKWVHCPYRGVTNCPERRAEMVSLLPRLLQRNFEDIVFLDNCTTNKESTYVVIFSKNGKSWGSGHGCIDLYSKMFVSFQFKEFGNGYWVFYSHEK